MYTLYNRITGMIIVESNDINECLDSYDEITEDNKADAYFISDENGNDVDFGVY